MVNPNGRSSSTSGSSLIASTGDEHQRDGHPGPDQRQVDAGEHPRGAAPRLSADWVIVADTFWYDASTAWYAGPRKRTA